MTMAKETVGKQAPQRGLGRGERGKPLGKMGDADSRDPCPEVLQDGSQYRKGEFLDAWKAPNTKGTRVQKGEGKLLPTKTPEKGKGKSKSKHKDKLETGQDGQEGP